MKDEKDHGASLAEGVTARSASDSDAAPHDAIVGEYVSRERVEAFRFTDDLAVRALCDDAELPFGLRIDLATYHKANRTVTEARIGLRPEETWQEWQFVKRGDWVLRRFDRLIALSDDDFTRRYMRVKAEGK